MTRVGIKPVGIAVAFIALCSQADATLIPRITGTGHRRPLSQEMNPAGVSGVLHDLSGTGTLGPTTFLAALNNPAAANLPGPVSGAVDSSLFSVAPNGPGVTVSWDLTGTGYTIAFALLETDFFTSNKPPVPFAQYAVFASDQQLDVQGSQFLSTGGILAPVSHVSFYGVKGLLISIPENANSLLLLVIGSVSLFLLQRLQQKGNLEGISNE